MAKAGSRTLTPIRGRRYRVTRLDACGLPVYGDDAQAVTKGVVTAAFTANTTETEEIRVENSGGETCVYEPGTVSLEGHSGEITLCGMDPQFFNIITGMPVVYDINGVAVGVDVDTAVDLNDFAFGLEIWTGVASEDACGEVGETAYGYILLPYMKGGVLGDITVENGAINFVITGATSRRGGQWGRGPYDVVVNEGQVAGPLLQPLSTTSTMRLMLTNVAPPADTQGSRPLLDRSASELTAVTGITAPASLEVSFAVTPDADEGEGVWYEFGDDTWDYVLDGGDTIHTYAEAGTYTVRASSNGDWVTTTVTVPGA